MKLRLTQPGFEHYDGQMGVLDFVDGVSTTDVERGRASRLAAVMLCELEDGQNPSIAQAILDNANTAAPIFSSTQDGADHDRAAGLIAVAREDIGNAASADKPKTSAYSMAQLEAIADKEGIKGLREISDPRGIKSNSIRELIDAILKMG